MRYVCEICGYETEDEEDFPEQESEADFHCPVCGSDRDLFYPEPSEYAMR